MGWEDAYSGRGCQGLHEGMAEWAHPFVHCHSPLPETIGRGQCGGAFDIATAY
jgi:hypothetical protein